MNKRQPATRKAKVNTVGISRQPSRSNHRTVKFAKGDDEGAVSDIQDDDGEPHSDREGNETNDMLLKLLKEASKSTAKKISARALANRKEREVMYTKARENVNLVVKDCKQQLEQVRAQTEQLKAQELSYQDSIKDLSELWNTHDEASKTLLDTYPHLINDLFPKRPVLVDKTSAWVIAAPGSRQEGLRRTLKNFNNLFKASREQEKNATDASRLIRHYKDLLLA